MYVMYRKFFNTRNVYRLIRRVSRIEQTDQFCFVFNPHFLEELTLSPAHSPIIGAVDKDQITGTLKTTQLQTIQQTLDEHEGNISATAAALGISRATLYRKLKDL